jgi:hypothetical protein
MNSAQRRQDARKWKYHVRLTHNRSDQNGYDNMFDWCCNTFGNGIQTDQWREKHQVPRGTWWQFTDSKAAVLFALKWS